MASGKTRTIGLRVYRLREIKSKNFEAYLYARDERRHQPDIHRWEPEAPTPEINQFSVLGEQAPSPLSAPSKAEEKAMQGRKSGDPAHPVEAPPLPDHQHVTISPPSPDKEEGEVTPSGANIPDSIARALLDALQEKWNGNQLPAIMISLARVRASRLQQCLVTALKGTIQATLNLISLGQEPSGLMNLADKLSTVSHALEGTSIQSSTAVPAQINISSRGLTPTTDDGETTNYLSTATINSGNICPQLRRDSILGFSPSSPQHQVSSLRMSANDIPEQLFLRGTSDEDALAILTRFRKRVELKDDLHVPPEEINNRAVRFLVALETCSQ